MNMATLPLEQVRLDYLFRGSDASTADLDLYHAVLEFRLEQAAPDQVNLGHAGVLAGKDAHATPALHRLAAAGAAPLSLEQVLADIRQLPSLPAVVGELVKTLNNEFADIGQIAKGIAKDQSLAARALRVANSPFYGIQHEVASIHEAIVILGFRAVGSLVMAASVMGYFPLPVGIAFDLTRFWRHGIGTALCARALARASGGDAETAFTVGLLHDIGVLLLATTRPTHYAKVLAWRAANDCLLVEAEQAVLGFDHAQAGEALASRWGFPAGIARAVALHHAPGGGGDMVAVAHVANILAHALDLAGDPRARVPPLDMETWRRLGLDRATLKALLAGIEQEHENYCALLAR